MIYKNCTDLIALTWLFDWLRMHGVNHEQLLFDIGILKSETKDILRFKDYLRFYNYTAETLFGDNLGLMVGASINLGDYGVAGRLAHHCETLRESIQIVEKYVATVSPVMSFTLHEDEVNAHIKYDVLAESSEISRHDVDMTFVSIVRFFRTYTGAAWSPTAVFLKHCKPVNSSMYKEFFGTTVWFDQPENSVTFPSVVLTTQISERDPELIRALRDHANALLAELGRSDSLVSKVKYSIASTAGTELCNAQVTAEDIFMSTRTMNRQLEKLNTSFRSLKQIVIEEAAKRALLSSNASITEIAHKLGYSETSAFDRAFKKITGVTPSDYRQRNETN